MAQYIHPSSVFTVAHHTSVQGGNRCFSVNIQPQLRTGKVEHRCRVRPRVKAECGAVGWSCLTGLCAGRFSLVSEAAVLAPAVPVASAPEAGALVLHTWAPCALRAGAGSVMCCWSWWVLISVTRARCHQEGLGTVSGAHACSSCPCFSLARSDCAALSPAGPG